MWASSVLHTSERHGLSSTLQPTQRLSLIYVGPICSDSHPGATCTCCFQLGGARLLQIHDGGIDVPLSLLGRSGARKPPAFCFEILWNEGALDSEDKCGLDQTAELLER